MAALIAGMIGCYFTIAFLIVYVTRGGNREDKRASYVIAALWLPLLVIVTIDERKRKDEGS